MISETMDAVEWNSQRGGGAKTWKYAENVISKIPKRCHVIEKDWLKKKNNKIWNFN